METEQKLKPATSPLIFATAAIIVVLLIAGVLKMNFGEEIKNTSFGIFWALVAVVQFTFWLKTKNPGYFIFFLMCAGMSFSYISGYKGIYFIIPFVLIFIIYFYFIASRQIKWRYRNILELAALGVNEAKDGFTARPMPAGSVDFKKEKFTELGKFLSRNLIAFPVEKSGNFFLLIRNSRGFWFQNPNIQTDSYISFNEEGSVSVNISKKDYQKYKEELTFDQLCSSLARMFIEFWDLFGMGNEKEIINRLDSKS